MVRISVWYSLLTSRTRWKALQSEVEGRQELVTRGKDQLGSYTGQAVAFAVWLTEAEARLEEGGGVPRSRERLFAKIEEFDVSRSKGHVCMIECVRMQLLGVSCVGKSGDISEYSNKDGGASGS